MSSERMYDPDVCGVCWADSCWGCEVLREKEEREEE